MQTEFSLATKFCLLPGSILPGGQKASAQTQNVLPPTLVQLVVQQGNYACASPGLPSAQLKLSAPNSLWSLRKVVCGDGGQGELGRG